MNSYLKRSILLAAASLGWVALSVQAASFDCAKAGTEVEHMICDNPEISKLDDDLSAAYKAALQGKQQADAIKREQKQWLSERNICADAGCVRKAYEVRLAALASPFKGEYILMRAWPGAKICQRFNDNLNRFRKLDFDQCNPRLSDKFPEFSRPYEWKETPFDMALAEKAIRSTTDYDSHGASASGLEYMRKLSDELWQQWKKDIDPFRAAGTARMWLAKIDIDGDGEVDTLLRMVPGGRYRIDPERPSRWACDYNIGELYVIEAGNPPMAALFNKVVGGGVDIIHFAENNHYYLLTWEGGASSTNGWFNQGVPSVGGTRGVTICTLYRGKEDWKNNYAGNTPAEICLIDWVPAGRYTPAAKPKHTPDTH